MQWVISVAALPNTSERIVSPRRHIAKPMPQPMVLELTPCQRLTGAESGTEIQMNDILDVIAEYLDDEHIDSEQYPKVTVANCRTICTNKIEFATSCEVVA